MLRAKAISSQQLVSTYNGEGVETQTVMNEDSPSLDRGEKLGSLQNKKNNLTH